MNAPLRIRRVQIHPLAIPMRFRFEHAAAERSVADPVLVRIDAETPYSDLSGWGETLARRYVTGETVESVIEDIRDSFTPLLVDFRVQSFAEALERIDALPNLIEGRIVNAARAAVELALLDLAGKAFRRSAADVSAWMELRGLNSPVAHRESRYSGIVVGRNPRKLQWLLRAQRAYGLRDFKIKVAVDGWERSLAAAHQILAGAITRGSATLRADANGAWSLDEARKAIPTLRRLGVSALEQPLAAQADADFATLATESGIDFIADESLLTIEDAERLLSAGVQVLNIRIAKNGGLMPALRMAALAKASHADVQLGCLVGETSILTAAGVCFQHAASQLRFVEGAYGSWLMNGDVARRPLRFGFRGSTPKIGAWGLGVTVDRERVRNYTTQEIRPINL